MKRLSAGGIGLIALTMAGLANAEQGATHADAPVIRSWNWTGGYIGAHVGAAWGQATFSDPFGPSIYGDGVSTPAFLGGGQIGFNWQAPGARWVLGIEADVSALSSDGTNTCLAYSGFYVSANCRVQADLAATLTGRVGYAAGPSGRSLLYLKGGLAGMRETIDVATNAVVPASATTTSVWKWGATIGAGLEQALAPAWSLKLEYDYLGFGPSGVPTPGGYLQVGPPAAVYDATSPTTSQLSQDLHMVKIGLNYRFGMDARAGWPTAASTGSSNARAEMPPGWEAELGGRYWFSTGRFQKDLGATTFPGMSNVLNSRLNYATTAHSGEFFGRVDSPWNIFAKGFIGTGGISSGSLNDEDWLIFNATVPYSNTLSSPLTGTIDYATIDLGYNLFRSHNHKLGLFVGYNYYSENKTAWGCAQFANPSSVCQSWLPNSVRAITEATSWSSLRVGVNGEIRLWSSVRLGGDIAYLPYVQYSGTDNHVLRGLISPEWGTGNGVQLEAILSYDITPAFSVGVGGRYWAMWTTDSYVAFGGFPCPCQTLPAKGERSGIFVQASYRFAQSAGGTRD